MQEYCRISRLFNKQQFKFHRKTDFSLTERSVVRPRFSMLHVRCTAFGKLAIYTLLAVVYNYNIKIYYER